jgi:outer membrane protein assembly factor BamB
VKLRTAYYLTLVLTLGSMLGAQQITRCGGPTNALSINSPVFHFDVCHTGYNPYEHILSTSNVGGLVLDWAYTSPTNPHAAISSPAVVNGVVYIGAVEDYTMYALNAHDGTLLWSYQTSGQVWSSPAVENGIVYFGSYDGNLYALNATTGTLIWKYDTGGQVAESPTVVSGIVYTSSGDGSVYALRAATGTLVWKYTTGNYVRSSPAVVNGVVYFGSTDHYVYALNAITGTLLWKYDAGDQIFESSPAVFHGIVYIGVDAYAGTLIALNASSGQLIWSYPIGVQINSSPAIANGIVYLAPSDDYLYAIDAVTGTLAWKVATPGGGGTPTVANGVVYCGGGSGLSAFDAGTGAILWNTAIGVVGSQSTPVVVNGVMYIGTNYPTTVRAYNLLGQ